MGNPIPVNRLSERRGSKLRSRMYQSRGVRRKAELRLAENISQIKDIAENAGFRKPAHFNHTFKKWTGLTPASYRKQSLLGDEHAFTDIRD